MGPNVRRLICEWMAIEAVPPGGGTGSAVDFLLNPKRHREVAQAAARWVESALTAVKSAPDNTLGDDDEVIAAEILRRLAAKKERLKPTYR